jgi:colanic acid/amylovoran biosynthesis glycosyltransferase
MKVAFIVSKFPTLSETFVLNQITGLISRGYHVDIFASMGTKEPTIHADFEKFQLREHTYYYRQPIRQRMPKNKLKRLADVIKQLLVPRPTGRLPLLKALNIFKFGKRAASLALFYQTLFFLDHRIDQYDIVHCHFGPNGIKAAFLKDVGAIQGKLLTVFHGYDLSCYLHGRDPYVYDHLFQVGDIFLPISELEAATDRTWLRSTKNHRPSHGHRPQ